MDIAQIYNAFAAAWTGKRVDYDKSYGYQCVDSIREYWYEHFQLGNAAGGVDNATDYWTGTPVGILAKFDRIQTDSPQIGDVVMLSFNHIGISNGVVGATTFQILDQNGGDGNGTGDPADVIQVHTFERAQILGVLRAKGAYTTPPYTVQDIPTKTIQLNKATDLWNFTSGSYVSAGQYPAGYIETTAAIATMLKDGTQFYLVGDMSTTGFNYAECSDYVAPPAPVAPVYELPAAPQTAKAAQRYTLLTDLPSYATALDAMAAADAGPPLTAGDYFVWTINGKAMQLGTDNVHEPIGNWVNTINNHAKIVLPAPETVITPAVPAARTLPSDIKPSGDNDTSWRATYKATHPDGHSDTYELLLDVKMVDYSGKRQYVIAPAKTKLNVTGTFIKGGVTFYRVRADNDVAYAWWYGISMYNDDGNPNLKKNVSTVAEEEQKLSDIWYYLRQDLRKWMDVKILRKVNK